MEQVILFIGRMAFQLPLFYFASHGLESQGYSGWWVIALVIAYDLAEATRSKS